MKPFYTGWFLASALLLPAALALLGIYLQLLTGDLARIAEVSERDFGATRMEQALVVRNNHQVDPDVAVLGDSFSRTNVWQSVVAEKTGHKFMTLQWVDLLPTECLEPWLVGLKRSMPSIRTVILETVERELYQRFRTEGPCLEKYGAVAPYADNTGSEYLSYQYRLRNLVPDPVYAFKALRSTSMRFDVRTERSRATIVPLARSDLFSNRRSDVLLYYALDDNKRDWKVAEIAEIATTLRQLTDVARRLGITLQFMMIPDKSTAYAPYVRDTAERYESVAWRLVGEPGISTIDPRPEINQAVPLERDVYRPDDTHVSNRGFELLATAVARTLEVAP